MDSLFTVHKLNENGMKKAQVIAEKFDQLLRDILDARIELNAGREIALVRTHLEQACFYAKKAMAKQHENHEVMD